MPISVSVRLGLMMFLNYVIWGAWYVTIGTYLTATLKFSGTQTGAVFGTTALASMISPFFVGMIADRFFATERVLAILHLIGAVLLYAVTRVTSFGTVYGLMLAYCLCYFPTIALTNSLAMRQMKDAGAEFPLIRVLGTIGWIAIGQTVGWMGVQATSTPFLLAAGASVAMSVFSLFLPHTPALGKGQPVSVRSVLGLDALVMLKRRSYLVFILASILACIPLTFYFSFTNAYLNEVGVQNAVGKMTLGQVSEIGAMLLMPFVFRRVTVKAIFLVGLISWSLRYGLLAYGDASAGMWMFYAAILLHGICYDFFFMTGQLYADQEAPPRLRVTAQGFLTFVTYGVGMFVGSLLSGVAVDFFTTTNGGGVKHDWHAFWLSCGSGAFVILLLVAAFFRSGSKIGSEAESSELAWGSGARLFLGAIVGGLVGFLLRPSVPLVGQLDVVTVLTRGIGLSGMGVLLRGAAEQSFNYVVAGIILGVVGAVIISKLAGGPPAKLNRGDTTSQP